LKGSVPKAVSCVLVRPSPSLSVTPPLELEEELDEEVELLELEELLLEVLLELEELVDDELDDPVTFTTTESAVVSPIWVQEREKVFD
jgi:hypothetical protein